MSLIEENRLRYEETAGGFPTDDDSFQLEKEEFYPGVLPDFGFEPEEPELIEEEVLADDFAANNTGLEDVAYAGNVQSDDASLDLLDDLDFSEKAVEIEPEPAAEDDSVWNMFDGNDDSSIGAVSDVKTESGDTDDEDFQINQPNDFDLPDITYKEPENIDQIEIPEGAVSIEDILAAQTEQDTIVTDDFIDDTGIDIPVVDESVKADIEPATSQTNLDFLDNMKLDEVTPMPPPSGIRDEDLDDLGDELRNLLEQDLNRSKPKKVQNEMPDLNDNEEDFRKKLQRFVAVEENSNTDFIDISAMDADHPSTYGQENYVSQNKIKEDIGSGKKVKKEKIKAEKVKVEKVKIERVKPEKVKKEKIKSDKPEKSFPWKRILVAAILLLAIGVLSFGTYYMIDNKILSFGSDKADSSQVAIGTKLPSTLTMPEQSDTADITSSSETANNTDVASASALTTIADSTRYTVEPSTHTEKATKLIATTVVEPAKPAVETPKSVSVEKPESQSKKVAEIKNPAKPEKIVIKNNEKKKTTSRIKRHNNGNEEIYSDSRHYGETHLKNKNVSKNRHKRLDRNKDNENPVVQDQQVVTSEEHVYTVEIYSSQSKDDAEQWLKKLQRKNINGGFIKSQQIRDITWYRVRFGSFSTREEARAAAIKLGFAQIQIDRVR